MWEWGSPKNKIYEGVPEKICRGRSAKKIKLLFLVVIYYPYGTIPYHIDYCPKLVISEQISSYNPPPPPHIFFRWHLPTHFYFWFPLRPLKISKWNSHSTWDTCISIPYNMAGKKTFKKMSHRQCCYALVFTGSSLPSHLWPHWPCMEVIFCKI